MDEKHNCLGNLWENFQKFLHKIENYALFKHILNKILKILRYFFARLDEKCKLLGNFEIILKVFDKNSIEKYNFYLSLAKLWPKIEPSKCHHFFQHFFQFRGGDVPCVGHRGAYVPEVYKWQKQWKMGEKRLKIQCSIEILVCNLKIF